MHIAFALMIAVPAMALTSNPLGRVWWSAYPLLVFFVIVATGNHFWFDAAAGAAVACVAAVAARQLARVAPRPLGLAREPGDDHRLARRRAGASRRQVRADG